MSDQSIEVLNPKGLDDKEFESIGGSELHAAMVKNRFVIPNKALTSEARTRVRDNICEWLKENCNSTYYVSSHADTSKNWNDPLKVFIESDADAINFKMFFHGQDLPEVPEPAVTQAPPSFPKHPKPRPIPIPKSSPLPAYEDEENYAWHKEKYEWHHQIEKLKYDEMIARQKLRDREHREKFLHENILQEWASDGNDLKNIVKIPRR